MLALASLISTSGAESAQTQVLVERAFPRVDEAARDATLVEFRTRLLAIVEKRDEKALLEVTSPNVMFSFGAAPGVEGFRKHWRLDEGATELWTALDRILHLGGAFQGPEIFIAPYVFPRWPAELADDVDLVATVAEPAEVRATPEANGPVIERLAPSIIRSDTPPELEGQWHRVALRTGGNGYLAHADARRPTDLRAFFSRSPTGWLMVICMDGD